MRISHSPHWCCLAQPCPVRVCKALIKGQLSRRDFDGAVEDFVRYELTLHAAGKAAPVADIRALVEPYLVRHAR
jgi:LuxR family maltose regulon positive regulatory protein